MARNSVMNGIKPWFAGLVVALGLSSFIIAYVFAYAFSMNASPLVYALTHAVCAMAMGMGLSVVLKKSLQHEVIEPLTQMGQQAQEIASEVSTGGDVRPVAFDLPETQAGSEVATLAEAMGTLVDGLKSYADDIETEGQHAREMENFAGEMARIAYRDPLTHVKSKAAYDENVKCMDQQIVGSREAGVPLEFSVAMIDLNDLKHVNDTYGHQAGNDYLTGACELISSTFKHSPVFRIGGDEFAVIMTEHDHRHRRQLVGCLEDQVRARETQLGLEPWERYSMAVGTTAYDPARDPDFASTMERADAAMYARKQAIKRRREAR